MKLITKTIANALSKAPLYSTEGSETKKIICKFFFGAWTWYVVEAEKQGDDWMSFGIVDSNGEREWGYFTLSQLLSVKMWGMPCVERDLYFKSTTIKNINDVTNL